MAEFVPTNGNEGETITIIDRDGGSRASIVRGRGAIATSLFVHRRELRGPRMAATLRDVTSGGATLAGLFAALLGLAIELHVHRLARGHERATVIAIAVAAGVSIVWAMRRAFRRERTIDRIFGGAATILVGVVAFVAAMKAIDRALVRPMQIADATIGWALLGFGATIAVVLGRSR